MTYSVSFTKNEVDRARRAPRKLGWRVEKSQHTWGNMTWRGCINRGGLMLFDQDNLFVAGTDYNMTPAMVLSICAWEQSEA